MWCGSGFLFDADANPDPEPTFHPDAYPDPDPDPSFQIKAQTLEKVLKQAHITYILQTDADPDPACNFDTGPDADPDHDFYLLRIRIQIFLCGCGSGPTTLKQRAQRRRQTEKRMLFRLFCSKSYIGNGQFIEIRFSAGPAGGFFLSFFTQFLLT